MELDVPQPNSFERRLLILSIRLVRRVRHRVGSVLMLTNNLCVKYGQRINLVEAHTMIYIARHTSIPVPKVQLAFTHKNCTYILMERIHGQPVGEDWIERPQSSRQSIFASLKDMIHQMRTLPTQSHTVANLTGGSLFDPRLPCVTGRFGPFEGIHAFHDYLRDGIQAHSGHHDEVAHLISLHGLDWGPLVFTHGDLSSLNILVRGDRVVGIVDWETAGWYPAYWEYTTACQVNPQNSFWKDEIDNFLEPMPKALTMERLRQKHFGDF